MDIEAQGHILFVKDFEKMKNFYSDTLGFEAEPESELEGWVVFKTGSSRFCLHAIPEEYAQDIEIDDPPKIREGTPVVSDRDFESIKVSLNQSLIEQNRE